MSNLYYHIWEDFRFVISISVIIGIISFVLAKIFTNKLIIFIPTIISALASLASMVFMLLFEGKNGVLQHVFLGILTYSFCIFVVTIIISVTMILTKGCN